MQVQPLKSPTVANLMKKINENVSHLANKSLGLETTITEIDHSFVNGQILAYRTVAMLLGKEITLVSSSDQEGVKE